MNNILMGGVKRDDAMEKPEGLVRCYIIHGIVSCGSRFPYPSSVFLVVYCYYFAAFPVVKLDWLACSIATSEGSS